LEVLQPHLQAADIQPIGKVAIGTVKGDLHDIGKNLVGMMLEGNGFDIIDLGVDVAPGKFINAVIEEGAKLVGLSSLLTTTMPGMAAVIDAFEDAGVRDQVKIMIGGAPVTQEYADKIGADGYATDASSAVTLAKALLN
jgi:5-methyltetrahydrofolate--homocysteine methyltransferase